MLKVKNLFGEKAYQEEIITKEEAILTIDPDIQLASGVYMEEALVEGSIYRVKFVMN